MVVVQINAINAVRDESDLCLRQGNRPKYKKSSDVSNQFQHDNCNISLGSPGLRERLRVSASLLAPHFSLVMARLREVLPQPGVYGVHSQPGLQGRQRAEAGGQRPP